MQELVHLPRQENSRRPEVRMLETATPRDGDDVRRQPENQRAANLHVLVLALATFAISTGTFIVTGLLPGVANDLSVSVGTAGHLVTVFAVVFALSSPVLVALTGRESHVLSTKYIYIYYPDTPQCATSCFTWPLLSGSHRRRKRQRNLRRALLFRSRWPPDLLKPLCVPPGHILGRVRVALRVVSQPPLQLVGVRLRLRRQPEDEGVWIRPRRARAFVGRQGRP